MTIYHFAILSLHCLLEHPTLQQEISMVEYRLSWQNTQDGNAFGQPCEDTCQKL